MKQEACLPQIQNWRPNIKKLSHENIGSLVQAYPNNANLKDLPLIEKKKKIKYETTD